MAEPISPQEEIDRYLLGQLAPAARRTFEARLEQDAELRQQVRELEEGLLALAMTAPRRKPPEEVWTHIEGAVRRPWGRNFWRLLSGIRPQAAGWGVAAGLALALVAYMLWFPPSGRAPAGDSDRPAALASQTVPIPPTPASIVAQAEQKVNAATNSLAAPGDRLAARAEEMRLRINGLETLVAQLSQMLKQQQAAAGPKGGLQFAAPGVAFAHGQSLLSPDMQQAVLQAVANQMGWNLSPTDGNNRPVDIVDLPSSLPGGPDTNGQSRGAAVAGDGSKSASASTATVPMLAWDDKIMAAVDPATLPSHMGPLTVLARDAAGNEEVIGSVAVDQNPVVIDINNADTSGNRVYSLSFGGTNVIGHFP